MVFYMYIHRNFFLPITTPTPVYNSGQPRADHSVIKRWPATTNTGWNAFLVYGNFVKNLAVNNEFVCSQTYLGLGSLCRWWAPPLSGRLLPQGGSRWSACMSSRSFSPLTGQTRAATRTHRWGCLHRKRESESCRLVLGVTFTLPLKDKRLDKQQLLYCEPI